MKDGEITIVHTLEELRECPNLAIVCDATGRTYELGQTRKTSTRPDCCRIPGIPGIWPLGNINTPAQVWWPHHPDTIQGKQS